MQPIIFFPSRKYLVKLVVGGFFAVLWPVLIFGLSFVSHPSALPQLGTVILILGIAAIGAFGLAHLYYRTIRFEIHADEMVVYAGLITKTVKHVPFRTITNLKVTRGIIDRLLGIGSLSIETAGSSGTTKPEEKLVGLEDVQGVYEYVAQELRRFRGALAPNQAEQDVPASAPVNEELLRAMLYELRAIRAGFEQMQAYIVNNGPR